MSTNVQRMLIPLGGDFQTRVTVARMRKLVNDSLRDPIVLQTATDAVRGVNGKDPAALARRLRAFLASRVSFLPDPAINGEVLRAPRFLIDEMRRTGIARADCDDVAMLAAALAKAIGLRARFAVLAFFTPRAPFEHVYTEAETALGAWQDFDVTENPSRRVAPSRVMLVTI